MTDHYNYRLESLRGLAALSVAMFHIGQSPVLFDAGTVAGLVYSAKSFESYPAWLNLAYRFVSNGQGAVVLFFVLSGHVLMLSLERETGHVRGTGARFILRRLARIYPPYISTIILCAILFLVTGLHIPGSSPDNFSPSNLLSQLLLYRSSINGVAWSLQVELLGAAIVLLSWVAYRQLGVRALIAVLAFLFAISFTKKANWPIEMVMVAQFNYAPFLYAFIVGMMITEWSKFLSSLALPPRLLSIYPVAGLALLCASPELFGTGSKFRILGEVMGAAAIVTGIVLNLNRIFGMSLDSGFLRYFGRISYSFYLLHPLTFIAAWQQPDQFGRIVAAGFPPALLAFILFALSVAIVAPLAALNYRLVEVPSINFMKRLGSRRSPFMAKPFV